MRLRMTAIATTLVLFVSLAIRGFAQDDPGVAAKAGHTLDELGKGIKAEVKQVGQKIGEVGQGIKAETHQVTASVSKKFEDMKAEVNKMPTHHRVYSRIHWDKELNEANIEVHMMRHGAVLLRGTVPTEAGKKRAVELAMGSVGVTEVYDELTFPAVASDKVAASPKAGASK